MTETEAEAPAEERATMPRKRVSARSVAIAVAVVVAALVALLALSPNDDERPEAQPLVGRLAPTIKATTTDGSTFTLDDLRGGWVLANFFATWCAPCVAEQPELIDFAKRYEGQAYVVSISFNDDAKKVKKFFADHGGNWPVIAEGNAGIALDYGVIQLPESYLIDPRGCVVHKFNGGVTSAQVASEIVTAKPRAGPVRQVVMRSRTWAWAALGVVLVVLLAIGARTEPTSGTSEDRLFAIAEQMKCLACAGESVANSQAELAVQMRGQIRTQMRAGKTDDEILSYFADRYGARVLLRPASSGLASLVWIVPVVATAAALAGLSLAFMRWRRLATDAPLATDDDREVVARARRSGP